MTKWIAHSARNQKAMSSSLTASRFLMKGSGRSAISRGGHRPRRGYQLPTRLHFIKFRYQNERIEILRGLRRVPPGSANGGRQLGFFFLVQCYNQKEYGRSICYIISNSCYDDARAHVTRFKQVYHVIVKKLCISTVADPEFPVGAPTSQRGANSRRIYIL